MQYMTAQNSNRRNSRGKLCVSHRVNTLSLGRNKQLTSSSSLSSSRTFLERRERAALDGLGYVDGGGDEVDAFSHCFWKRVAGGTGHGGVGVGVVQRFVLGLIVTEKEKQ